MVKYVLGLNSGSRACLATTLPLTCARSACSKMRLNGLRDKSAYSWDGEIVGAQRKESRGWIWSTYVVCLYSTLTQTVADILKMYPK